MAIRDEILEEILKEYKSPEDLIGKDGILKDLTKRLIEKAMGSELTHHLGYDKYSSAFPNDEAAIKLLYLSLKNIQKKWTMPARNWGKALNQFAILYGDRMP